MPRPKPKPVYASPEDRELKLLDADSSLAAVRPNYDGVWEFVAKLTLDLDNKDAWAAVRRWRQSHKLHGLTEDWIWVARAHLRREEKRKEQTGRKLKKPVRERAEFKAFKKMWNQRMRPPRATWPLIGDL